MNGNSVNCYYCKKEVDEKDLVEKRIPLKTKKGMRMYRRKLHIDCVDKIVQDMVFERENKVEEIDWRKCYEKFRELLGYDSSITLSNHAVMRIKGLRVGKYIPNGSNTTSIKAGYTYDVILKTLMFCSSHIRSALKNTNFKDENHKIDYCMKIVTNNIDFINTKIKARKIADSIMDNIAIDNVISVADYKSKGVAGNTSKVEELLNKSNINDEINFDDLFK